MDKVLIDSDVILDFFFDRAPFSESAAQIFSLCESKQIEGFVTPVICSNLYYLLRRVSKHEKVIKHISQLLTIMDVLSMDRDVILQALGSGFNDFEDALQNFSAVKSGYIDVILTRNVRDYIKSDIGILTPESYIKTLISTK